MKKLITLFVCTLLFSTMVFAQENPGDTSVNENELKSTVNENIEFINYTGPHKKIDTLSAIKGIGSSLGNTIVPDTASTVGDKSKYYVIHAVDTSGAEKNKLNADIMFIGKNATVDHIKNLRRIISAYLTSAYDYSEKDADTLAIFITVYNAVYRGKQDVFESKYKKIVLDNLSVNCGLSVNYKDWPGNTEIVIPLNNLKGGLSAIDTSVISDSTVVESMQEEEDKEVEPRKDMVDLKEREAEEASEKAQEAQKQATEEQTTLNELKKEAEEAEKEAKQDPTPENKKIAEEKKEEVEEQQKKVEEAKEEAKEQQTLADKKQNEAQEERKEIAQDQQEVQDKEAEIAKMGAEYGIILSDEKEMLSRLVKFNVVDGQIIKKSPVTEIRNRTVYKVGTQYMAIAGENTGNGAIKLVLIDDNEMEIVSESNEIVAEHSVLIKDGDDYYCIIQDGNNWVVGKYDGELVLKLKSPVAVKESTPLTVTDSGIVVTARNGQLKLLSKTDLTSITKDNSADAK
ncbi:MAG: hypothetical protein MJ188_07940 [Treponema sp.]|nr:hypothetical protein [Treponema sp.]